MPQLEPIQLKLTGSADGLSAALGKAKDAISSGFSGGLSSIFSGLSSKLSGLASAAGPVGIAVGAALAAIGAAAAGASMAIGKIREAMDRVDEANDKANKLGTTVNERQKVQLSLQEATGADEGTIDAAIQKLQVNLAEAAQTGTGKAFEALQKLGIQTADIVNKGPSQQILMLSERISQVKDKGEQTRLTFELMGKSGLQLAAAFRESPDDLREAMQWAEQNLSINQRLVEQIGMANDVWGRIGDKIDAIWNVLSGELAPIAQIIGEDFLSIVTAITGVDTAGKGLATIFAEVYGWVKNILNVWLATTASVNIVLASTGQFNQIIRNMQSAVSLDGAEKTMKRLEEIREEAMKKNRAGASDADIENIERAADLAKQSAENTKAKISEAVMLARDSMKDMKSEFGDLERNRERLMNQLGGRGDDGPLSAASDRASQIRRVAEIKNENKRTNELLQQINQVNQQMATQQQRMGDLIQKLVDDGLEPASVINMD